MAQGVASGIAGERRSKTSVTFTEDSVIQSKTATPATLKVLCLEAQGLRRRSYLGHHPAKFITRNAVVHSEQLHEDEKPAPNIDRSHHVERICAVNTLVNLLP